MDWHMERPTINCFLKCCLSNIVILCYIITGNSKKIAKANLANHYVLAHCLVRPNWNIDAGYENTLHKTFFWR